MFTAEYGSFRGYISYPIIFSYYPPIEQSIEILSIILMGYAFIRFYFNFEKFSRLFLIASSCLTVLTYIIVAPLWIRFLDAATHVSISGSQFIGDQFHSFRAISYSALLVWLLHCAYLPLFCTPGTDPSRLPGWHFWHSLSFSWITRFRPLMTSATIATLRSLLPFGTVSIPGASYCWSGVLVGGNPTAQQSETVPAIPAGCHPRSHLLQKHGRHLSGMQPDFCRTFRRQTQRPDHWSHRTGPCF